MNYQCYHSVHTLFDSFTDWESSEVALSYFEVMIAGFYMLTYSGKCEVAATRGHKGIAACCYVKEF